MNSMIVIAFAGLISYALRSGLILIGERWTPPAGVARSTSLIAPAAFAAIAATAVRGHVSAGFVSSLPLIGGLVVGAYAVRRTGSANTALIAGLPTVWMLSVIV